MLDLQLHLEIEQLTTADERIQRAYVWMGQKLNQLPVHRPAAQVGALDRGPLRAANRGTGDTLALGRENRPGQETLFEYQAALPDYRRQAAQPLAPVLFA